jgi:hypothetical protein
LEVAAEQDDDDDDTVLLLLVRACSGRFFMSLNLWMVDQAMEVGWFTELNKHVSSDGMVEVERGVGGRRSRNVIMVLSQDLRVLFDAIRNSVPSSSPYPYPCYRD